MLHFVCTFCRQDRGRLSPALNQFASFVEDQQLLGPPTLALSPPVLDHVGRDQRQASEDRKPHWLVDAVTALKDEP